MSKTDLPFEYIKVRENNLNKPHFFTENKNTKINGFDSETYKGNIYLLTYKFGDERSKALHNNSLPQKFGKLDVQKIFKILTNYKCRNAINVWYNLNFDVNVILKLLPEQSLKELSLLNKTTIKMNEKVYRIEYIPNKLFKIKDIKNDHTYNHFDVSQFFFTNLNSAVKEWLNESKEDDFIKRIIDDSEEFEDKNDFFNEKQNILDFFNEIKRYGKKDAELVQKLWQKFVDIAENDLSIPTAKPYSTGYLAEQAVRNKLDKKSYTPKPVQKDFWNAYNGGRFEVFKRGNIGDIVVPDINSAYPSVMKDLPDPNTLTWKMLDEPEIGDLINADYGVVTLRVTTNINKNIQPFCWKKKNTNLKFPRLYKEKITVILPIFLYAYKNNFIEDFELISAKLGYENSGTSYSFNFIEELYRKRKDFENEGKHKKAHLLKIVLNSLYGKTIQTTPQKYHLQEFKDKFEDYRIGYGENEINLDEVSNDEGIAFIMTDEELLSGFEDFDLIKMYQTGNLFNPFLASYITGKTRLKLMKTVYDYNLENSLVMFATDSVMIEKNAFNKTSFEKDLIKKGLGNWDYDVRNGEGFIIGSGVYEVKLKNENGEYIRNEKGEIKRKVGARGFSKKKISEYGLTNLAEKNRDKSKLEISKVRPKTFSEILWNKEDLKNIGNFLNNSKKLSAGMDDKRQWFNSNITFGELLEGDELSEAIDFERKHKEEQMQEYENERIGLLEDIDLRQSIQAIGEELFGDQFDEHFIDSDLTKDENLELLKQKYRNGNIEKW